MSRRVSGARRECDVGAKTDVATNPLLQFFWYEGFPKLLQDVDTTSLWLWQAPCTYVECELSPTLTNGEKATMKRTSLILIAVFTMVMLPAAFGQGTPSQSQDPNTQPTATPSQQTPSAEPAQTPSTSSPSSSASPSDAQRMFVGSIAKNSSGKFVLHTGGTDYQLDDQAQAGKFDGKDVKVTGQLDQSSNTIRVQSIEPSSSM